MTYKRLMVDVSTGEQYEEDLTPEEIAELEAGFAIAKTQADEAEEKATQKAALLDRLGITEDEAKLLLA